MSLDLDFSQRVPPSQLPELMDGESSYEEFLVCLRSLERCNRWLFGYRPTLNWLNRLDRLDTSETVHILDVGSGYGDLLRKIDFWAKHRSLKVHLTGIDLNPHATRAAAEATGPESGIHWITGDALRYQPEAPVDIVVSSLTAHHLEDEEIVTLLRWMEQTAQTGWYINDLERSEQSYVLFGWLATLAGFHRFVKHDGPVSIRRALREPDWKRLLAAAGIASRLVTIEHWRPGRLCIGRVK